MKLGMNMIREYADIPVSPKEYESKMIMSGTAVEGVEEVSHYETVTEYPGGGRDVRKVIDVPGVPAQATWTEQVPVQRYIRYTEEELAAREKERQQAEEAARLPETIASLTCQLTDLQLALCELYEGGGV